jgi:hypothetical protein
MKNIFTTLRGMRGWAKLAVATWLLFALGAGSATAQEIGNTMLGENYFVVNQKLRSTNGKYLAWVETDGNLVLYDVSGTWKRIWHANVNSPGGSYFLHNDGNLCSRRGSRGESCIALTGPIGGKFFMVVRDIGALEIYRGSPGATNPAPAMIWTTQLDTGYYSARYEDLRRAFGTDVGALMRHWIDYGRTEGRSPNPTINDDAYLARINAEFMAAGKREMKGYDFLRAGDWINARGGFLQSQDGRFKLTMQTDGNLCLYANNSPASLWCSLKNSLNGNYYTAVVLPSGLICVYYESGFNPATGRITPNANGDPKGNPRYCLPDAKGGSNRGYFFVLGNDASLNMFRTGNHDLPREPVWNRSMVGALDIRDGSANWFDVVSKAVLGTVSGADNLFRDGYQVVANGAQSAVAVIAKGSADAAQVVEKATVQTANTVARETQAAAEAVARETANAAVVVANATVNTANKIANDTTKIAVTVGRTVQDGSQVVGKEIVKNGEIVGYAVANLAVDAWSMLKTSCGQIGRKVFPIDPYFQGYKQINGVINTYGGFVPGSAEYKKATDLANQCFDWAQDGFYCAFPAEIEKIVSQAATIPGNLINLATRVFNEAKTKDCLIAGAASVQFGAMGLQVCALGKVVVSDAQKAFACFSAAESKGVMKKFYTPLASAGEKANPTTFPNQASCNGIGELAFEVAEKILTNGLSAEAKAAKAAGKSNTVAMVADQLRTVYKIASAGAKYDDVVRELDALPECK